MNAQWSHSRCATRLMLVIGSLVLFTPVAYADTTTAATDTTPASVISTKPEFSFWVDAAPMSLVIDQLAELAGKTSEQDELADMSVSGRFSGSLDSLLASLSASYPVAFDIEGELLRATNSSALTSVSIATLGTELDEDLTASLMADNGPGNKLEFREDAVRLSGHPAFVQRAARSITRALVKARGEILAAAPDTALVNTEAGGLSETTVSDVTTTIADSGSAEVLVDIQDEGRPPADQATLSRPIRWVTDIPGYNTF